MAHGNISDGVFLAALVISIAAYWAPSALMLSSSEILSTEESALIRFSGGATLMLGFVFSGVKWNPINGLMTGIGCFLHTANCVYLGLTTGLLGFYASAAVLLIGGCHVFFFPSNPKTPKTPETKNNHGNMSDIVALLLMIGAAQCVFAPGLEFMDVGPVKASFSAEQQAALQPLISFCGSLVLIAAMMFSGIKWNPINGKMGGLGCFFCVASFAYMGMQVGSGVFFYYYALLFLVGGAHIFFFPSNPLPPKAEDAKSLE